MPTKDTRNKSLDAKQIKCIIESCAAHGVTSLKLGNLQIEFGTQAKPEVPEPLRSEPHPTITPEAEISETKHKIIDEESLREDERRLREDQIAELLVTDPLAAEQMMMNGELEDADSESEDDEL